METQALNLFIVDDNKSMVTSLKQYLKSRFGGSVNIRTFLSGESAIEKVDKDTHVVVLDYAMEGKDGLQTLREIKEVNPGTEVIMLSSNNDIAVVIESMREGAADYVVKGPNAWRKLSSLITYIINAPFRLMAREFPVSKFCAIFLTTFITMGAVVATVLNFLQT